MIEALFLAVLSVIVFVSAWTDVRQRRIPNWLCAINLIAGLTYIAVLLGWYDLGLAAFHVLAALVVAMALTAAGAIGAGDAKFYASFAAWLPIQEGLWLLVSVALSGLVLLIFFLGWRLSRGGRSKARDADDFAKLPYGVAIGIGGLVAVALP